MRSHLLEGIVRHRRARPFAYALRARRVLRWRSTSTSSTRWTAPLRLVPPQPAGTWSPFRDEDHLDPPAADVRAAVLDHLRARARTRSGWRITLVTNLRVLGLRLQPGQLLPVPRRATACLRVVIVEVHNTHGERHLYTLRPRRRGPATFVAAMDKAFYVSPFIEMRGGYTVRVRDEPARLRITINERPGRGPRCCTRASTCAGGR